MKAADRRPPAQDVMLGLISGYWVSQLVFVAAQLGVADELAERPLTAAALAKRVGAQPDALHRVLRALASVGVFAETNGGRFRLTPAAATLRSDVPGSLRNFALEGGEELKGEALKMIERAVKQRVDTAFAEAETPEDWDVPLLQQDLLMHYLLQVPSLENPDLRPTTVEGMNDVVAVFACLPGNYLCVKDNSGKIDECLGIFNHEVRHDCLWF